MKKYGAGIEPDSLPFVTTYMDAAKGLEVIDYQARGWMYGAIYSGVISQLVSPSQEFLPGGQFFDRFANVLTSQEDPTEDELFDIGIDIGASLVEQHNQNPQHLITGYLNACIQLGLLRMGMIGQVRTRDIEIESSIAEYACRVISETLPLDARTDGVFKHIGQALAKARQVDYQHIRFFEACSERLQMLSKIYLSRKESHDYIGGYYSSDENISAEERRMVDNGVGLLSQEAMRHRKYGTKPAYIEASTGGAWVFYDGDAFLEYIRAKSGCAVTNENRVAALAIHVPQRDLSKVDLAIASLPVGKAGNIERKSKGLMAANPDFVVIIHLNGSMSIDPQGLSPVEAVMADDPDAARRLKAEVASLFYDLSMPIDMGERQSLRNYAQMSAEERSTFNPVRDLLIPRLRYLQTPSEESSETSRAIRRHDVTWHVRLLPPGWHPSPEAVENARKVGVVLAPNETFVRAHERGVDNKILGYHAVRRATELEPGTDY